MFKNCDAAQKAAFFHQWTCFWKIPYRAIVLMKATMDIKGRVFHIIIQRKL